MLPHFTSPQALVFLPAPLMLTKVTALKENLTLAGTIPRPGQFRFSQIKTRRQLALAGGER
jgi:hypothetical protein